MKRVPLIWCLVLAACVLGMMTLPLLAQSGRGTLTGVVNDPQGALVPGAEIIAINKANGAESKAVTTSAGLYRIPYLEPGTYNVTAALKGFKTAARDNVNVLLAQTVTLDFTLEVGEITQTVEVSGESPLLEASTAEIGTNATDRDIHSWPIFVGDGTRQLQDFVFRALPGTQGSTFEGTINGGQQYSHEILIDGISIGRMDLNGGSNNEFTPTIDAVSEFKLQTGALSSQYGNTQTALTNFGLKSGTNDIHGSLFWINQNKLLNANTWESNRFGSPKSPNVLNNFGLTVGGPLKKDKTHFFFSYEGNRQADFSVSGTDSLPYGPFKQGDFSKLFDPAWTQDPKSGTVVGKDALGRDIVFGQIYDPSTTRQLPDGTWIRDPFPGNIIPKDRFSKVTENILQYDIPNPQTDRLKNNNPRYSNGQPILHIDNYSGKIDHLINDKHKLGGAIIYNKRYRLRDGWGGNYSYHIPGLPLPGPPIVGDKLQNTPGWIVRLNEDWTISPTKLNHMAFGYNRFRNANQSNALLTGRDWEQALGMQGVGTHAFPQVFFSGNNSTLNPYTRRYGHDGGSNAPNGSTIFNDDFTWIHSSHSLRFGGEIRRYYITTQALNNTGRYYYHNEQTALPDPAGVTGSLNATGFAYASFMLGDAQRTALDIINLTPGMRSQTAAFYVQDDWKVSSKLSLNLGFRWDIPTPFWEVKGAMSGLDPTKPNPGADGFPGAFVVLGDGPGRIGGRSFASTYYREFGPRLGFAYALNQKTVLRGGYGINYAPPIQDGWPNASYTQGFDGSNPIIRSTSPFVGVSPYNWDNPYPPLTATFPNTDPTLLNGQAIGWYPTTTNKMAYVQNWNFGIQYELPWQTRIEANYIGNRGNRLNEARYRDSFDQVDPKYLSLGNALLDDISLHPEIPKPYPSFEGSVARALRPWPQYDGVGTHHLNTGWSTYHSLQTTLTKRASNGLSFLISYTFSKNLATSDSAGPGDYYYNAQNFYNRRQDYSVSRLNVPHTLRVTWIYDLPFGPHGKWLRSGVGGYTLGGWTMSAIQHYQSGNPLSLSQSAFEGNALFNPGLRADILQPSSQWILPSGTPTNPDPDNGTPYLNPAAFGQAPVTDLNVPIRFGNAPRYLSQLRGFAGYGEDFSVMKRTSLPFREGMNFELRLDITNLFNRIGICNPNTDVSSVDFGKIYGKCGGSRHMQWGARFTF